MYTQDDLAKAAMHWMANNTGYLQIAIEDLSDTEFDALVTEVVGVGSSSSIVEAITTVRENAGDEDAIDLSELLKYRKALLAELTWVDDEKKRLMKELNEEYPEEKVTTTKPRGKK